MEPRIYVYKITFVDRPEWYWGVHKEKRFDEYYMGSPYTHKKFWELYQPIKEIIEVFDYSDAGWLKACGREQELIRPDINNPLCLNESCGNWLSLAEISENSKRLWQNEEFRRKQLEKIKVIQPQAVLKALTTEVREKRKETLRRIKHQQGETNSMYGTMWVTNGTEEGNLRISKGSVIPEGYRKGRAFSKESKLCEKRISAQEMLEKAREFEVDLTKKGWTSKLAEIVGVHRATVLRVVRSYAEEMEIVDIYLRPKRN